MKISAINAVLPSQKISNDDVIDKIREQSKPFFQGDLEKTLRVVYSLLKKSGSETRGWFAEEEKPIELIKKSAEKSLNNAGLRPNDIDMLIYVGIGRGFVEPAQAYFVAKTLGMDKAHCFDIIDACMSWSRAVYIIDHLLKAGSYKNIMVVNAECNISRGVSAFPKNFQLRNKEQLEYSFPAFTVGEGITSTIFTADGKSPWEFHFSSHNNYADLCTLPVTGYEDFCSPSVKVGTNGAGFFTSYGSELHKVGAQETPAIFRKLDKNKGIDIIFTHASSKYHWNQFATAAGYPEKVYHIYQRTGNLVSASIPTAIFEAFRDNKLKRGDSVVCWVGSAGMSFCVYRFIF